MHISDRQRLVILIGVSIAVWITYFIILEKYANTEFGHWPGIWKKSQQVESDTTSTFAVLMKGFPWKQFKLVLDKNNHTEIGRYATNLLLKLVPFLLWHPQALVNKSCKPPQIPVVEMTEPCKMLQKQRKVGILWQLGFDVDVLEIHLNELDAVVDKFFIMESVKPHSGFIPSKPLIWDMLKYDSRFARFSEKVVHFIVDDASLVTSENEAEDIAQRERLEETLHWERFLEWNAVAKYFGDNDLLGFGNVDEVPDRDQVNYLKECAMPSDPVGIDIWCPLHNIKPSIGQPQTLGGPTFWTLASARSYWRKLGNPPSRMRDKNIFRLSGGMHLSRYPYPSLQTAELLTASDKSLDGLNTVVEAGILYSQNEVKEANEKLTRLPGNVSGNTGGMDSRNRNITEGKAVVKMPWFLKCNRKRFHGFDKLLDFKLHKVHGAIGNHTNESIDGSV